jgi:toxin ParE1/3/4
LILDWTELAEKDREGYIDYIAQDNPLAAVHVGDEIERQVEMLLQHPKLGRVGRVKGTRELVIAGTPYIAAYCIKGDFIHILRVLHGAMDWKKQFSK